jgi:ribose/xylose/arabinose/galactoside ABC-type transport system permease subunit
MNAQTQSWKRLLARHETILFAVLLAEVLYFLAAGKNFGTTDNIANIIRHTAEIGLLALVMMPIILTGGIDLSVGSLLGLCAVLFGVFTHDWHLTTSISIGLTILVGALAGAFNAALITQLRLPPLIVTLGTFSLFRGLAEAITQGTKTYRNFAPEFAAFGEARWLGMPAQAWVFALIAALIWFLVHRTVCGRSWRAIGFAPEGATYAGIPVGRRIAWTYIQAGAVVAVAAILFTARLKQARADAGSGYELAAITAVVLGGTSIFGGIGTVYGTLLGIGAIAVLSNGLGRLPVILKAGIGGELASLLTGALLLIALAAGALTKTLSARRARTQSLHTTTSP